MGNARATNARVWIMEGSNGRIGMGLSQVNIWSQSPFCFGGQIRSSSTNSILPSQYFPSLTSSASQSRRELSCDRERGGVEAFRIPASFLICNTNSRNRSTGIKVGLVKPRCAIVGNREMRTIIQYRRIPIAALTIAAWLGLVATGFAFWERYESTPGRIDDAKDAPRSGSNGWELVLFVHPHCPCSRASLQELAELTQRTKTDAEFRVVFVRPENAPEGWEHSELWDVATAIPRVRVSCDSDGSEARR